MVRFSNIMEDIIEQESRLIHVSEKLHSVLIDKLNLVSEVNNVDEIIKVDNNIDLLDPINKMHSLNKKSMRAHGIMIRGSYMVS